MRHEGAVLAVCVSPDSKQLLTGSGDKTARLWAVPSGALLAAPIQHSLDVWTVRFSPDGARFLTVVPDRPSVRVWDSATARLLTEVFADRARVAEFSPDGRRIVTGSMSGTVQLWDARTGERLSEPLAHQGWIHLLRISSDAKLLAVRGNDGLAKLWEMTPAPLPLPDWLPELAEALVGQRFNQQGLLQPVSPVELWAVQEKLTQLAVDGADRPSTGLPRSVPTNAFAHGVAQPSEETYSR